MNSVFLINLVDDPYCGDRTVCVATSVDEAKKLGFPKLWHQISYRPADRTKHWEDPLHKDEYVWQCVVTGEKKSSHSDLDRPSPYYEEVQLNTVRHGDLTE